MKFNRQAYIVVGDRRIDGLRIEFNVERIAGGAMSKATINVYNADLRETGAFSEASGQEIQLYAGYESYVGLIFKGVIANVRNRRENSDIITVVYASDVSDLSNPIVARSWNHNTSLHSIINDIAQIGGVFVGEIDITDTAITGRLVLTTSFTGALTQLGEVYEFNWEILNQKLEIYRDNSPRSSGKQHVFSADNGLMETPIRTEKGVNAKVLLSPEIRSWDTFKVISTGYRDVRGGIQNVRVPDTKLPEQRIISLIHIGDTHSDVWFTEMEGISV